MIDVSPSDVARTSLRRLMKDGHGAGDDRVIEEVVAADFVLHCPDGTTKTRDESAQTYAAMRGALSPYTLTCDLVVAEGEMVAARTMMSGDFARPFGLMEGKEIEPHGGPVHFETISIYRFDRRGRLLEEWAQSDNMTLFSQLGVKI